jgi:hypothetical protein
MAGGLLKTGMDDPPAPTDAEPRRNPFVRRGKATFGIDRKWPQDERLLERHATTPGSTEAMLLAKGEPFINEPPNEPH